MQIKYALSARNDRRKGRMALSMACQFEIEFGFKLIFHHAGFRGSHYSTNSRLGDLHRFTDGIDLFGCLDLTHLREQWITILDREMGMPILDVLRELALDIKRTFGLVRVKTKPKGGDVLKGKKFMQR